MKKLIIRMIPVVVMALVSFGAAAQNVQLHYDLGRGSATTTVEMFRADNAGSTFFFVDLDYNPKVSVLIGKSHVSSVSGRTVRSTGSHFILSIMAD